MLELVAGLTILKQTAADPMQMPIGRTGLVATTLGTTETDTGRPVSLDRVLDRAALSKFVYIGESHDNAKHHQFQAAVIDGLARRGHDVIIGFEMFTRPVQGDLDPWTLGKWTEDEFIARSDWKKQWGFDYGLYKPIFEAAREHKLRMVALNVPRDWVRAVGRGGWAALTAEQKAELPNWTPPHKNHFEVFKAMIGGADPGMTEAQFTNMRAAQCLWDAGMADSAVKYMRRAYVGQRTIFVVIAGSGHIMYDAAIPYRIDEYLGVQPSTTIVCIDPPAKPVSRGLADFVYVG